MLYANEVVIQGTIVHKYKNDKVTILTVSTGRNSADVVNYPKVVFFNTGEANPDEYEVHDRVTITGNVQSSFRRDGDRPHTTQSIYGESIGETPRVMETFGVKEGSYEAPKNQVKLAGELTAIDSPAKNVVRMLIKTMKNNRTSNVQAFYFTQHADKVMEDIKAGDNVCAIASMQTSKKTKNEQTTYYENVVVQYIEKVEA